ncbi:hypothetical protein G4D82_10290 [Flavobacterium sp. CYK-4]|uniref:UPF0489 family protein n=1 Tax=Flavobacterium lotistagni TaxID=2709660 RepID=UPI00140C2ED8|nr:UPF0489 family protein [Flavobacterium lotistagni]NHM07611.1 hypothetical protein [Flavobacterium lotistagni]
MIDSTQLDINGKKVFICEEHHHVLKFWHQFREQRSYLLTFDHHTDLHRAFQGYLNNLSTPGRRIPDQDSWDKRQAKLIEGIIENDSDRINDLKHDEHIDAALKAGFIKKALVYSHDSYHGKPERVYCINGDDKYAGQLVINNSQSYKKHSTVINAKQLEKRFGLFDLCIPREEWMGNFILDIDLDFFQTTKSITPKDISFFKLLIDKSIAISIAKESTWINTWKNEYDSDLSVEFLLDKLLHLIES